MLQPKISPCNLDSTTDSGGGQPASWRISSPWQRYPYAQIPEIKIALLLRPVEVSSVVLLAKVQIRGQLCGVISHHLQCWNPIGYRFLFLAAPSAIHHSANGLGKAAENSSRAWTPAVHMGHLMNLLAPGCGS